MQRAILLPILTLLAGALLAQDPPRWDNSGNGLLKGKYRFREVAWLIKNEAGEFDRATSMNGTIEFDGDGKYSITALVMDSQVGSLERYTKSGTYRISSGGLGFLTSPLLENGTIFGLVSNGIFIASSTEDAINDLMIAVAEGEEPVTNASFQGRFRAVELNLRDAALAHTRGSQFDLNPDGQGNLAAISVSGYIGGSTARRTQTVNGAAYSFENGEGSLRYGGSLTDTNFLSGDRVFYMSPDRSFIFGGSATGFDLFAGVRALEEDAPPELLNGLFYEGGVDVDLDGVEDGFATLYSYYGAGRFKDGDIWGHQRLYTGGDEAAYDYTYSDFYELSAGGIYEDFFGFRNIVGAGGRIRIGFGQETYLGLHLAMRAPTLEREGVFLNPTAIVNAASRTPFTVGTASGALLQLGGTNLAPGEFEDSAFPTSLGGVQVLINDKPVPLSRVTPEQITAQTPYGLKDSLVSIQVVNNGEKSNVATAFLATATPGVFSIPAGGIGLARAFHSDGSAINADSPARLGETITVHVTGLGETDPPATAGITPPDPLSLVAQPVGAYFGSRKAAISRAALAPGLAGVYALQMEVPADVRPGDAYLDVSTPDAYTSMVVIPVARPAVESDFQLLHTEQRQEIRNRRGRGHDRPVLRKDTARSSRRGWR